MNLSTINRFLRSADGVSQLQRSFAALSTDYVRMDERSQQELVMFWLAIAKEVRFFDPSNQAAGDWAAFFQEYLSNGTLMSNSDLAAAPVNRSDWTPHIALQLAFLKLFEYAQADLNTLTSRHLGYYYEKVLQLRRGAARADQVHLLFELTKNASPQRLVAGTLLNSSTKTTDGQVIQFALDNELIVNHTTIGSLKSAFVDRTANGLPVVFKAEDASLVKNQWG